MSEDDLKNLAIESELPLKAVGIENLKEANPQHMPPHRYLHPWWARRPTPASRLAVLASVLPESISHDELLKLMQINPKISIETNISKYVEEKKATESERSGTLEEHYNYPRPFTSSPNDEEIEELHELLRETWDGDVPKILDPTAGGGVIPFESLRYGLPSVANELNSVPSVMLKLMLEYASEVGSLESEFKEWSQKIDEKAKKRLEDFFPKDEKGHEPSHYACTYTIECPECGADIPLVKKWWLRKKSSSKGIAIKPEISDGSLVYECVRLPDDVTKEQFDPQKGPHMRGGAECLNCGVVAESETIKTALCSGEFEYEVYGIKNVGSEGKSGFRAPSEKDKSAFEKSAQKIGEDYELDSLLNIERYIGKEDRAGPYGVTQWRDSFSPRQLISHYEYWKAFEEVKTTIKEQYGPQKSEAILSFLALVASKMLDRNSRASPLNTSKGYPENALGGMLFSLQWAFVDNNPTAGSLCYRDVADKNIESYEKIVDYLRNTKASSKVLSEDASDLSIQDEEVQAVVVDPPYYDSIIYSEMADFFYVWMEKYLGDVYPNMFDSKLTDKSSEAVANVAEYEGVSDEKSSTELAKEDYEKKMSEIFNELYRVLEAGGVMTVMFTHKETDAWDTLTKSLINSGFTITSTHPITSEIPNRVSQQGNASANSTLLLTGRKPKSSKESKDPTLWSNVKQETHKAARESAERLIESNLNLTKTDIIISAFGPTLEIFSQNYPVVDDAENEVSPKKALETARKAVVDVLVEKNLSQSNLESIDLVSRWYLLCWLVHESERIHYDEARQLGMGVGIDIDDIKRKTKIWKKRRDDIQLASSEDRVSDIRKSKQDKSSSKPVDPEAVSFSLDIDKVHAAIQVYRQEGDRSTMNWMKERNYGSSQGFRLTLKTLLELLPKEHEDWKTARDLIVGKTGEYVDIELDSSMIDSESEENRQTKYEEHVGGN
jgi:adenine-specific DNA methylase